MKFSSKFYLLKIINYELFSFIVVCCWFFQLRKFSSFQIYIIITFIKYWFAWFVVVVVLVTFILCFRNILHIRIKNEKKTKKTPNLLRKDVYGKRKETRIKFARLKSAIYVLIFRIIYFSEIHRYLSVYIVWTESSSFCLK